MKFRRKPSEVDAIQYFDANFDKCADFTNNKLVKHGFNKDMQASARYTAPAIYVRGEGWKEVKQRDWILKDGHGECCPMKEKVFRYLYEPAKSKILKLN